MTDRLSRCRPFFCPWGALIFVIGLAVFSLPERTLAETDASRADVARTQTETGTPSLELSGGVPSSPNDADIGEQAVLKRSEGYQAFTVVAAVPAYWTSNVALARSNEQDDFLAAPLVGLTYQPKLTDQLYALASVREQLFYYDEFDDLNFGSFDAGLGLIYTVPQWHNVVFRGEFLYNRLTDKDSFDAFFENYSIFVNAEVPFSIGRAQRIVIGADANISLEAVPEPPRRHDYEAYIGYNLMVTRALSIDAVGRVVVRQYQLTDRVDVSEVFGASANYTVTRYLTASAISTLAANQSNHPVFDYKVANVGGLLTLAIRF